MHTTHNSLCKMGPGRLALWAQKTENQGAATFENSGSKKETELARKAFPRQWKLPGSAAGLCRQIPFQHQQTEEGRWARPLGSGASPAHGRELSVFAVSPTPGCSRTQRAQAGALRRILLKPFLFVLKELLGKRQAPGKGCRE